MRWKGERQSQNVDDRRGISGRTIAGGGIGTVIIAVIVMLLGGDPSALLGQGGVPSGPSKPLTAEDKKRGEFVSVVLANTEDVWHNLFSKMGRSYSEPVLVLFTGQVDSACGLASAAVGPFYCPADRQLYIDLDFLDEMQSKMGAPGEMAQAYVIAHEVGHHVQNLLGISDKVHEARSRVSEKEFNRLSVRLELQADFFAGVWAHHAQQMKNLLDRKDLEDAVRLASAIGDDTLQSRGQGHVVPDSFTHGSSDQRVRWFRKGWESGEVSDGDTFSARSL